MWLMHLLLWPQQPIHWFWKTSPVASTSGKGFPGPQCFPFHFWEKPCHGTQMVDSRAPVAPSHVKPPSLLLFSYASSTKFNFRKGEWAGDLCNSPGPATGKFPLSKLKCSFNTTNRHHTSVGTFRSKTN